MRQNWRTSFNQVASICQGDHMYASARARMGPLQRVSACQFLDVRGEHKYRHDEQALLVRPRENRKAVKAVDVRNSWS